MKINLGEKNLYKIILELASLKCCSAFGLRSKSSTFVKVLFFYSNEKIVSLEKILTH